MKTTCLFLTIALLLSGISIFAQDPNTKGSNPFAKGNWSFDLNRITTIQQTNYLHESYNLSERTDAILIWGYDVKARTADLSFGCRYMF